MKQLATNDESVADLPPNDEVDEDHLLIVSVHIVPDAEVVLGEFASDRLDRDRRLQPIDFGDFDRARAREVMAEFLHAEGRRVRVLFAHSDTMALGAIEAIEAAGFKPGSDILVISIEGSRKALEAIVAGKLNATVECSPLLGPQLIAVVKELAAGKPVPKRVMTQESLFTRENAARELLNRKY